MPAMRTARIILTLILGLLLSLSSGFLKNNAAYAQDTSAGYVVDPQDGLITGEDGTEATFTVRLTRLPLSTVSIALSSSKPEEGFVSPTELEFNILNWMFAQPVTITGVDDSIVDGDQTYSIITIVDSADSDYAGNDPPDISVTNLDNDVQQGTVVANDDSYSTPQDQTLNVPAPGVLGNDSASGNATLHAEPVSQPANGALTLNNDGSFAYTPNPSFVGADSFTYFARSSNVDSTPATVTITVTAVQVNLPPVARNDSYLTNATAANPFVQSAPGVLANDTDPEGSTLSATLISQPANGSVSLAPDGSFTYTPTVGFNGSTSFTYQATDAGGQADPATVTLNVDIVAPPPVSWVQPDIDGTVNTFATGTISLEVTVDPSVNDLDRIVFYLWDPDLNQRLEIGVQRQAPYTVVIDIEQLHYSWNQIDAAAFDRVGNRSELRHIWVVRALPPVAFLPVITH